jgi:hypothetical protein
VIYIYLKNVCHVVIAIQTVLFHFSNVGFSTTGNLLQTYGRKAWLSSLSCLGNEKEVMECSHSRFSTVPSLQHTYKRGTWLYCFGEYINARIRSTIKQVFWVLLSFNYALPCWSCFFSHILPTKSQNEPTF